MLLALAAAVGVSLLAAVTMGGAMWTIHLGTDILLVGYLYLLVQLRKAADERLATVSYLPLVPARADLGPDADIEADAEAVELRRIAR